MTGKHGICFTGIKTTLNVIFGTKPGWFFPQNHVDIILSILFFHKKKIVLKYVENSCRGKQKIFSTC